MLLHRYIILVFFCMPNIFRPMGTKKAFLGLFSKAYSYNSQARHFAFGQCIVYIVSNKRTSHYCQFLCSYFYILKKIVKKFH